MSPEDRIRLEHMRDACELALEFVAGRALPHLEDDEMLTFALVRAIEVIGEAASKVTAATREDHPALPWSQIIGMRNRLIHAYFDVDRRVLWNTATIALPALLTQLREVLEGNV